MKYIFISIYLSIYLSIYHGPTRKFILVLFSECRKNIAKPLNIPREGDIVAIIIENGGNESS